MHGGQISAYECMHVDWHVATEDHHAAPRVEAGARGVPQRRGRRAHRADVVPAHARAARRGELQHRERVARDRRAREVAAATEHQHRLAAPRIRARQQAARRAHDARGVP